MVRLPSVLVLVCVLVPFGVSAAQKPTPPSSAAPAVEVEAGVVEGRVTIVDYQRGTMSVETDARRTVEVSVTPTTSVQAEDPGYHALTDVAKGARVRVFTAKNAGRLVAQIIRLIKH